MTCGEGGILGPVVGIMGVMQALEAIKIVCKGIEHVAEPIDKSPPKPSSMLVLSAFDPSMFRTFKLRGRRKDCATCSSKARVTLGTMRKDSVDYQLSCGAMLPVNVLTDDIRMEAADVADAIDSDEKRPLIIDVREKAHFDVYSLPGSVNIPYSTLSQWREPQDARSQLDQLASHRPLHILCRLGNDSQYAVKKLHQLGFDQGGQRYIGDVRGGWQAWRREVKGSWPDI